MNLERKRKKVNSFSNLIGKLATERIVKIITNVKRRN